MQVHDVYLDRLKKKNKWEPIQVYQNPTVRKISEISNKSDFGSVRCLASVEVELDFQHREQSYNFDGFFVADASDILHEEMVEVVEEVDSLEDSTSYSIEEMKKNGEIKDSFIFVLHRFGGGYREKDFRDIKEDEFWLANTFQGLSDIKAMYSTFSEIEVLRNLERLSNIPVYFQKGNMSISRIEDK